LLEEKGNLEKEKMKLEGDMKKVADELTAAQKELTELKTKCAEHMSQLTQQQEAYEKVQEEKENMEKELEALREAKNILNNYFHDLIDGENKVSEETVNELNDQILKGQEAITELEKIKATLTALGLDSENFKNYIEKLEEALSEANQKLDWGGQATIEVPAKK